jgi:acyl-coenzyme A thioesterase PaaI-like protein
VSSADRIAAVRRDYRHCFGCGVDNPLGLRLDGFVREGDAVRTTFTPRPEYRGFSDILHGGVVATALDETLAWTAILIEGVMVMTGTLNLRYRSPATADTTFGLEGRLLERRGRRLRMEGTMSAGDAIVAEAEGLFLVVGDV